MSLSFPTTPEVSLVFIISGNSAENHLLQLGAICSWWTGLRTGTGCSGNPACFIRDVNRNFIEFLKNKASTRGADLKKYICIILNLFLGQWNIWVIQSFVKTHLVPLLIRLQLSRKLTQKFIFKFMFFHFICKVTVWYPGLFCWSALCLINNSKVQKAWGWP